MIKNCGKCNQELPTENFYRNRSTKDGFSHYCKDCYKSNYGSNRAFENRTHRVSVLEKQCTRCGVVKSVECFGNNKNTRDGLQCACKSCDSEYYRANREKYKKRYESKRDDLIEYQKQWNAENKSKRVALKKSFRYRLIKNAYNRYNDKMREKGIPVDLPFEEILGCSYCKFLDHLRSLYQPGMTDDNYGEWEMDHIYPIYSFDLTDKKQQLKCFHFTNIQPLWKKDHLEKGMKIPE